MPRTYESCLACLHFTSFRNQSTDKFWKSKSHFRNQTDKFWKSKIISEIKRTILEIKKSFQESNEQIWKSKVSSEKSNGQILEIKRTHFGNQKIISEIKKLV